MLSNTITVEVTGADGSVLKIINEEKPVSTPLSSILGVVQTDVNDFLTNLVNKDGGDVDEFPDSGSANDDSETEFIENQEEKKRSVKRTEENSNHNKKVKI
nr:uncharacterized protein LOC106685012 [Halyomorpha halys]